MIRLEELFLKPEECKRHSLRSNLEEIIYKNAVEILEKKMTIEALGVIEIMPAGYGFLRYFSTYLKVTKCDLLVSKQQVNHHELRTGDLLLCEITNNEKSKYFQALKILEVNGIKVNERKQFNDFYDMKANFPSRQIKLSEEIPSEINRMIDLICPIGFGQRGIIASPPKCGKTSIIENIAKGSHSKMAEVIVLMVAERPEESTFMAQQLKPYNIKVISSSFDEEPSRHVKLTQLIVAYSVRQVEETGKNIMLLIDSLTRFVRATNFQNQGGKILTGGLDINSLLSIKPILGSARNFGEKGSLTVMGTMLIDTGSKMDDIIFDECKGTSNMDLTLNKEIAQKGIFPAIDIFNSSTRKFNLFLPEEEFQAINNLRRALLSVDKEDALTRLRKQVRSTESNKEIIDNIIQMKMNSD